jgi:hypothetical protein
MVTIKTEAVFTLAKLTAFSLVKMWAMSTMAILAMAPWRMQQRIEWNAIFWGLGKSTYTFSVTFRFLLSAPNYMFRVEPAGGGRGEQKAEDIWQKTYMLIYPDTIFCCTAGRATACTAIVAIACIFTDENAVNFACVNEPLDGTKCFKRKIGHKCCKTFWCFYPSLIFVVQTGSLTNCEELLERLDHDLS